MTRKLGLLAALLLNVLALAPAAHAAPDGETTIEVLSNRADLVSAGDALLAIGVPAGTDASSVHVTANGEDVSDAFAATGEGRLVGLVTGLELGDNVVRATAPGGGSDAVTIVNHAKGGPVFSGPQTQPWQCQESATDAKCNEPATFEYQYMNGSGSFAAYDPASPPADVAETTTDEGVTVPFIVRIEKGYIDRDRYQIATLFQPGQDWTAAAPQEQFNHKLLTTHGAGCGTEHAPAGPPSVTSGAAQTALGRGWAVMSHALNNAGHNCNIAVEAEAMMMTKEHLIERYGTLRYTIGTGCSGGSLAIQWIANAYPGIYQGILPSCSFPDAWGTASQFLDYHQTIRYFTDPLGWAPGVAWTPLEMAAVQGHITPVNSIVSDTAQFGVVVPSRACNGVPAEERYHPETNPGGVRCTIQDDAINIFGPRPESAWTAQEHELGRGWAGVPIDNVGVQYGLQALRDGIITPAQFIDLNAKIGGVEYTDILHTPERMEADATTLANSYRSGLINEGNNMDRTAIIDCRGPDPGAFHDAFRAYAMRARLDREHGGHRNQLIWEGPVAIMGDTQCEVNSFLAMDGWLAAIEQDASPRPLAEKVVANKPADLTDRCYSGAGQKLLNDVCGDAVVGVYGTPRMVAGDALTNDTNKCRLKALSRADSRGLIPFTDEQWAQYEALFPQGVCDYSKPGVGQQGTIPWQTYQGDVEGDDVIYGGRALPEPPEDSGTGWASKAFSG
jgi:hypothetical protein